MASPCATPQEFLLDPQKAGEALTLFQPCPGCGVQVFKHIPLQKQVIPKDSKTLKSSSDKITRTPRSKKEPEVPRDKGGKRFSEKSPDKKERKSSSRPPSRSKRKTKQKIQDIYSPQVTDMSIRLNYFTPEKEEASQTPRWRQLIYSDETSKKSSMAPTEPPQTPQSVYLAPEPITDLTSSYLAHPDPSVHPQDPQSLYSATELIHYATSSSESESPVVGSGYLSPECEVASSPLQIPKTPSSEYFAPAATFPPSSGYLKAQPKSPSSSYIVLSMCAN